MQERCEIARVVCSEVWVELCLQRPDRRSKVRKKGSGCFIIVHNTEYSLAIILRRACGHFRESLWFCT